MRELLLNKEPTMSDGTGNIREWTTLYNQRYGSGITRTNVSIVYPQIQNFTYPRNIYNDGSVAPPVTVLEYQDRHPEKTPVPHAFSSRNVYPEPLSAVDSNPNFKQGSYFPEYHKYAVYYDLPEFDSSKGTRMQRPQKREEWPSEVLRRI